ncbi:MAG: hypothetical protein J0H68_01320 [Sphingobacteriia bacterium]|nr:hypothetical protein [Sphingobacteriia bacterium]
MSLSKKLQEVYPLNEFQQDLKESKSCTDLTSTPKVKRKKAENHSDLTIKLEKIEQKAQEEEKAILQTYKENSNVTLFNLIAKIKNLIKLLQHNKELVSKLGNKRQRILDLEEEVENLKLKIQRLENFNSENFIQSEEYKNLLKVAQDADDSRLLSIIKQTVDLQSDNYCLREKEKKYTALNKQLLTDQEKMQNIYKAGHEALLKVIEYEKEIKDLKEDAIILQDDLDHVYLQIGSYDENINKLKEELKFKDSQIQNFAEDQYNLINENYTLKQRIKELEESKEVKESKAHDDEVSISNHRKIEDSRSISEECKCIIL